MLGPRLGAQRTQNNGQKIHVFCKTTEECTPLRFPHRGVGPARGRARGRTSHARRGSPHSPGEKRGCEACGAGGSPIGAIDEASVCLS